MERGDDFQLVLTWYGIERLLYRLSRSRHADAFILKGAMLFSLWSGEAHRPTRDLDLLGSGDARVSRMEEVMRELCQVPCDDGLEFDPFSVRGEEIRSPDEYDGVRIKLVGRLAGARVPLQVDIGFGDAVLPPPETIDYPSLLDLPPQGIRHRGCRAGDGRRADRGLRHASRRSRPGGRCVRESVAEGRAVEARLADYALIEMLRPAKSTWRQVTDKHSRNEDEKPRDVAGGPSWIRTRVAQREPSPSERPL
jgi:hypothetical protein